MEIREYLENIKNSVVSIFEGMAVTFSWMLRRPHTVQYPDRYDKSKPLVMNRFRGILEVDLSLCTACQACQRACPIGIISINVSKGVERLITCFDIDASKCMYCGLCTEACPTSAIHHSNEFAFSVDDIRKLHLHFVREPVKPYKPQKDVSVESSIIKGELILRMIEQREMPYAPVEKDNRREERCSGENKGEIK